MGASAAADVVGWTIADEGGMAPVGCCSTGALVTTSGAWEVGTGEGEADVLGERIGERMSESSGRMPVPAADDCCAAGVLLGSSVSVGV